METTTVTEIVVRSTDVDADGYVNNAVYHEYCEQARLDHLRRLGIVGAGRGPRAARFTIAENRCRYLGPVYYGDVLTVRTSAVRIGRSSFVLAYALARRDENANVAEAESVQVWLDGEGRPTPLPSTAKAALEATLTT